MTKLPEFDESQLPKNPFSYSLVINVTKRHDFSKFVTDKDGIKIPLAHTIEQTKATKIYHCTGSTKRTAELSDKAQRLYLYILNTLQPNKDYIRINVEHYLHLNNIKDPRTYKAAYKELINKSFIVGTTYDNIFHINPNFFFSGSLKDKYKENVKIVSEISQ